MAKHTNQDPAPEAEQINTTPEDTALQGQPPEEQQPPAPPEDNTPPEAPAPAPESVPVSERPLPYTGKVGVSLATVYKGVTVKDLRPVATLPQGAEVTVVSRTGDLAQLANGLYIREKSVTP